MSSIGLYYTAINIIIIYSSSFKLPMKSTASLFIFSPVAAAEELIQHLKSENDKLRAQVDDLRSEVTSIRYAFLLSNSFLL